jgi:hypothetical protein
VVNDKWNPEYEKASDFEYYFRTHKKYRYEYLPELVLLYRRHGGAHLSGNQESQDQHQKIIQKYKEAEKCG